VKRRVLLGVLAIALIAGLVGAFTYAYFSDPETATATFSAGIININVDDGPDPWTEHFALGPFKPSETGYIEFYVRNVGDNEAVIWKMIEVTDQRGGDHPESEEAEDPGDTINNLKGWMFYDLYVDTVAVIPLANEVRVDNMENIWIELGTLNPDHIMTVKQSYHLRPETTNWAQGDEMDFDITVMATQTNAPSLRPSSGSATLENKDAYWRPIADGVSGTVHWSYATATNTLSGNFSATGLPDGSYDLIYYSDPWPGTGGLVLGTGVSAGGTLPSTAFSGTPVPSATDTNQPAGVKVWLVPNGEFVPGPPATWPNGWNAANYLFDLNLIPVP